MKTSPKLELTQLAFDIMAPIKSMQGLVNLTPYVNSKEDAQNICKRLEKCSKRIDKRIAEAINNISGEKL